jgi:hypothetical protein
MNEKSKQIEEILKLFSENDEIVSFKELSYVSKHFEICKYCCNKPTKIWKYKNKKIKVCKKCCSKYRNSFFLDY